MERSARPLNRDAIKYFAAFTMLLNHFASVFLADYPLWDTLLTDIGYFTAITMCRFLVEGYRYTRSKKKYALRLLLFAVLAEYPFCLAFSHGRGLRFVGLDMLFTLFLCFLLCLSHEKVPWLSVRMLIAAAVIAFSIICDWPLMAPCFTILFLWEEDGRITARQSWPLCIVMIILVFVFLMKRSLAAALLAAIAPACAGLCYCFLYNGKRAEHGRTFSKWFFYLFYPIHLFVLAEAYLLLH